MGILEVVLLIAGIMIVIGSFLLPSGKTEESGINKEAEKEEIRGLLEELQKVRSQMQDRMEETSEDAVEKAERSLERLTNEKIMAINEYSDTVLQEIHKNHEEAMFLYDMLNSKHANIKDTVSKMDKAVKAVENKAKIKEEKPEKEPKEKKNEKPAEAMETAESAPEIGFTGETAEEGQNNNEKILKMHRQGKSTVEIAKELGLGVGEVKLVIDLYKA